MFIFLLRKSKSVKNSQGLHHLLNDYTLIKYRLKRLLQSHKAVNYDNSKYTFRVHFYVVTRSIIDAYNKYIIKLMHLNKNMKYCILNSQWNQKLNLLSTLYFGLDHIMWIMFQSASILQYSIRHDIVALIS